MPLQLNIGLSRKIGEANYGSRGASVNVEMELESALIGEPTKLRERIRQLFGVVRDSLTEELNGNGKPAANGAAADTHSHSGHGAPSNGSDPAPRPATASQIRALQSICKSQRVNLDQVIQDRFRVRRPEDLSIKQASELIDHLKSERK